MNRRGFFGSLLGAMGLGALVPKAKASCPYSISTVDWHVAWIGPNVQAIILPSPEASGLRCEDCKCTQTIFQHYNCFLQHDVEAETWATILSGQLLLRKGQRPVAPYRGYKRLEEKWTRIEGTSCFFVGFKDIEVVTRPKTFLPLADLG